MRLPLHLAPPEGEWVEHVQEEGILQGGATPPAGAPAPVTSACLVGGVVTMSSDAAPAAKHGRLNESRAREELGLSLGTGTVAEELARIKRGIQARASTPAGSFLAQASLTPIAGLEARGDISTRAAEPPLFRTASQAPSASSGSGAIVRQDTLGAIAKVRKGGARGGVKAPLPRGLREREAAEAAAHVASGKHAVALAK